MKYCRPSSAAGLLKPKTINKSFFLKEI